MAMSDCVGSVTDKYSYGVIGERLHTPTARRLTTNINYQRVGWHKTTIAHT